jgi:hypothetical protein
MALNNKIKPNKMANKIYNCTIHYTKKISDSSCEGCDFINYACFNLMKDKQLPDCSPGGPTKRQYIFKTVIKIK